MSSTTLYRLNGISLFVGAILAVGGGVLGIFSSNPADTIAVVGSFISFVGASLGVLSLPGLYARQAQRAGVLGLLGVTLTAFYILILGVFGSALNAVILPYIAIHAPALANSTPPVLGAFDMIGGLLGVLGGILLGVATIRAAILPRWLMIGWITHEAATDFLPASSFYGVTIIYVSTNMLLFALIISVLATQVYRYRHATSFERQQIKWVIFGFATTFLGVLGVLIPGAFFPAFFQPGAIIYFIGNTAIVLFLLLIPLSIAIAILRYRLWDIDILINRTLVYGALTASVIGVYVLVVGYLGALFRTGNNLPISLLATSLVAVLFQPLRGWLQRGVNRLMYGQRDEPYTVIGELGRRLEGTPAPEAMLPMIVMTVAQALKLPYAAITLTQRDDAATYGTPVEGALVCRSPIRANTLANWRWGHASGAKALLRRISGCWPISHARWASPRMPSNSPPICNGRAKIW